MVHGRMNVDEAKERLKVELNKGPFSTMSSLIMAVNGQEDRKSTLHSREAGAARKALIEEEFLLRSHPPIKKNPKYKEPEQTSRSRSRGRRRRP